MLYSMKDGCDVLGRYLLPVAMIAFEHLNHFFTDLRSPVLYSLIIMVVFKLLLKMHKVPKLRKLKHAALKDVLRSVAVCDDFRCYPSWS